MAFVQPDILIKADLSIYYDFKFHVRGKVRLGKDRLGKDRLGLVRIGYNRLRQVRISNDRLR